MWRGKKRTHAENKIHAFFASLPIEGKKTEKKNPDKTGTGCEDTFFTPFHVLSSSRMTFSESEEDFSYNRVDRKSFPGEFE